MNTRVVLSAIAILLVVIYAVGSGLWVNTGDGWYRSLNQPSWQPPDWIFGIIWPYNFVVLGITGFSVTRKLSTAWAVGWLGIFAFTVACALTWAYQFYVPHNLGVASSALWLVAVITVPLLVITFRASILLGLLLVPYQIWVSIATFLSFTYRRLN